MNKTEKIIQFRLFLLKQVAGLTTEQLNTIPAGYHNNIAWHMGHMVAAQQGICYARSGLPFTIDKAFVTPYLPGTKPEQWIGEEEISAIKERMITTINKMQADVSDNLFTNYTHSERIQEVYGVAVNNIDDALDFLLCHEGYHMGYAISLKHLV